MEISRTTTLFPSAIQPETQVDPSTSNPAQTVVESTKKKSRELSNFRAVTAEIDKLSKRIAANKKKLAKLQIELAKDFQEAEKLIAQQQQLLVQEQKE